MGAQRFLGRKRHVEQEIWSKCYFLDIPFDIFEEILWWLDQALSIHILHLALTSKEMFIKLAPRIYSTVVLRTPQHCLDTLGFLVNRPDVAVLIKELIIQPLYFELHEEYKYELVKESPSKDLLSKLPKMIDLVCQTTKNLVRLEKFVWEGWDLPERDEMWGLLKADCPNLHQLGITMWVVPGPLFHPNIFVVRGLSKSQLLQFDSLTSLSVHLRAYHSKRTSGALYDFPCNLLKLIDNNSAHLEQLEIRSSNDRLQLSDLLALEFPKLKEFRTRTRRIKIFERSTLFSFLQRHSFLRHLTIEHDGFFDWAGSPLTLDNLTSFEGFKHDGLDIASSDMGSSISHLSIPRCCWLGIFIGYDWVSMLSNIRHLKLAPFWGHYTFYAHVPIVKSLPNLVALELCLVYDAFRAAMITTTFISIITECKSLVNLTLDVECPSENAPFPVARAGLALLGRLEHIEGLTLNLMKISCYEIHKPFHTARFELIERRPRTFYVHEVTRVKRFVRKQRRRYFSKIVSLRE